MRPEAALPQLRRMLSEVGFDEARPELSELWIALKQWVAIPVDGMDPQQDEDMLLFECTLDLRPAGDHGLGPSFVVGFTRQLIFEDDEGEYAGMDHVVADLRYAVHDDFRALVRSDASFGTAEQFWGAGGPYAAEWVRRVEATASYRAALRHTALQLELIHTPV